MSKTTHHKSHAATVALVCGVIGLSAACGAPPENRAAEPAATAPEPAAAPAVTPTTSINELMVRWVDNASHVLWDVEKRGFAPKDTADWVEIEDHATQLMAAATLIQLGGTGPMDPVWVRGADWKTHASAMADAGKAAVTAARAKDLKALVEANTNLTASCENCHKVYKPDAPTEGLLHQNPHSASHEKP